MVIEKKIGKLKNSSFIARAIIENNKKFKIIDILYEEHKENCLKKQVIMDKIINIYEIGFKNFSRTKKLIGNLEGNPYYISRKGIMKHNRHRIVENLFKGDGYDTSELNDELVKIGKNSTHLKQHLKKGQKKIFSKFFKNYILLRNEKFILLKFPKPIKIYEISTGFSEPFFMKEMDSIMINPNGGRYGDFDFLFLKDGKIVIEIRFSRLRTSSGINEKIFIEQTFSYLRTLIKKEIKNREKEIKRLESFYSKAKTEFRDFLMLEVIEKDN